MEFLDWTWDNDGVPDTDTLKEQAFKLLRTAYDEAVENIEYGLKTDKSFIHSAGGLRGCVDVENGEIHEVSIDFVVESWCTEALESLTHYEMA